jgi:hypothetical protein
MFEKKPGEIVAQIRHIACFFVGGGEHQDEL